MILLPLVASSLGGFHSAWAHLYETLALYWQQRGEGRDGDAEKTAMVACWLAEADSRPRARAPHVCRRAARAAWRAPLLAVWPLLTPCALFLPLAVVVVPSSLGDPTLATVAPGQRYAEVARNAKAIELRGAQQPPGYITPLPTMLLHPSWGMPAAHLANYGIPAPVMGEEVIVMLDDAPWNAANHNAHGLCVRRARLLCGLADARVAAGLLTRALRASATSALCGYVLTRAPVLAAPRFHRHVNQHGPHMPGAGYYLSFNHVAWFKFAPVGHASTEPMLAVGGAPAIGNSLITSYDTGHGQFSAVRACAAAPCCVAFLKCFCVCVRA
jgi:hypothetical protein